MPDIQTKCQDTTRVQKVDECLFIFFKDLAAVFKINAPSFINVLSLEALYDPN